MAESSRSASWGAFLLVLGIAVALYGSYSLDGLLRRDEANCMYAGQRLADGVPPYAGMFTMAAPLSQLLAGLGVQVANTLGVDDLYATRVLYRTFGALAVGFAYLLGHAVLRCRSGAILTALTLLSFRCFTSNVVAGPQKKVPMVLFEILSLWLTIEKRWFAAGVAGALAALTWQPMLVFPVVTLAVAASSERSGRARAVGAVILGSSAPVAALLVYFYFAGALRPMFDGVVVMPMRFLSRPDFALSERIAKPVRAMFEAGYASGLLTFLGILGCVLFYRWRGGSRNLEGAVVGNPLAPIVLSLPAPIVWSLADFQHCPDLFVLYPYAALGFAAIVLEASRRVAPARRAVVAGVAIALSLIALVPAFYRADRRLRAQRDALIEIERRVGPEAKLVSIGAPEALVLSHRVNPNRYPFLIDGIGPYIATHENGGLEGFVQELAAYDPDVIAFGPTAGAKLLVDWVYARYERVRVGPMTFFLRKSADVSRPASGE